MKEIPIPLAISSIPRNMATFRQIVEGLVHIHAQGMMHRDLKPSNIFLDSEMVTSRLRLWEAVTRIESTITGRSDSPMHNLMKVGGVVDKSITGNTYAEYWDALLCEPGNNWAVPVHQPGYNQKSTCTPGDYFNWTLGPFATGMERVQCLQNVEHLKLFSLPGWRGGKCDEDWKETVVPRP